MSTFSSLLVHTSEDNLVCITFLKGIPFFNLMVLPKRMKNLLCQFSNSHLPCGISNTQIVPASRRASIYFPSAIAILDRHVLRRYEFTPSTRKHSFIFVDFALIALFSSYRSEMRLFAQYAATNGSVGLSMIDIVGIPVCITTTALAM